MKAKHQTRGVGVEVGRLAGMKGMQ